MFVGEGAAEIVQYGERTVLCDFIKDNVYEKPIIEGEKNLVEWLKTKGFDI
jgi:hypothetical protein